MHDSHQSGDIHGHAIKTRASISGRDCIAPSWLQKTIDRATGRQELCILGQVVLRLDPANRQCHWYWRHADSVVPAKMRLQPDLLAPLLDPTVQALFGDRMLQRSDTYDRLQMPTMAACRQAMKTFLAENPELAFWQQDWCRALSACQPHILATAQRARLAPHEGLCPALYSLVWRHEELFRDVDDNAPLLSPLLALVLAGGQELDTSNGALRALKILICSLPGCSPATWRWLLKWGLTAVRAFIKSLAAERGPRQTWEATTRFLSFWSRAGLPPPLPEPVAIEWLGRMENPGELERCCPERVALVAEHATGLSQFELRNQTGEMAGVLEQVIKPLPLLDRNQKRAGWNWLRRECPDKARGLLVDGETLANIRDQLPPVISVSKFDFVLLRDEKAFIEEGRLMDHCMDQSPSRYLNDGQLHFSIRRRASGRRVATCSLGIGHQRTVVTEVLGSENQPPPKPVRLVAEMITRRPELGPTIQNATIQLTLQREPPMLSGTRQSASRLDPCAD